MRELFDRLFVLLIRVLIILAFLVFVYFWVGSCIGNFLNVDEDPAPGLHFKLK